MTHGVSVSDGAGMTRRGTASDGGASDGGASDGSGVMGAAQAAAVVEARLDRPAQDALEAAVVLEAWYGVRPPVALRLGEEIMRSVMTTPTERLAAEPSPRPRWRLSEQIALVVALLALLAWSGPLIASYGSRAFELSWMLAVPLTLAAQSAIRRRYLAGSDGLGRLSAERMTLLATAVVVPPLLGAALGVGGYLAGVMAVLWVTAPVVGRRGWGLLHALLLIAVTVGVREGVPAVPALAVGGVGALVLAAAAVATVPVSRRRPGAPRPVLLSALTGCGLGLMLILEGGVHWNTAGPLPALVLLPSVIAGLYAGAHLDRLWDVLHVALRETSLRRPAQQRARRAAAGIVAGAVIRLVVLVGLLSAGVWMSPWAQAAPPHLVGGLLIGFAAIALATLALTMTESFGRPGWAVAAVGAAVGCEVAIRVTAPDAVAGLGLAVAGVVAVAVTVPPVTALLRQPARTLATVVHVQ